ncbi:MAG: ribonuclease HI family protein, partial [Planctomycetota bacterium]
MRPAFFISSEFWPRRDSACTSKSIYSQMAVAEAIPGLREPEEYTAVREGLAAAKDMQAQSVRLFSDSQLLVRQLNGQYRVKSENLKGLYTECMELLASFSSWQVTHVYREKNTEADDLANQAMDKRGDVEILAKPVKPQGKKLRLGI